MISHLTSSASVTSMTPRHVDPVHWHQAMGVARQSCARIFRDGGQPVDALTAFGLSSDKPLLDWSRAVDLIAEQLCALPVRKAA